MKVSVNLPTSLPDLRQKDLENRPQHHHGASGHLATKYLPQILAAIALRLGGRGGRGGGWAE